MPTKLAELIGENLQDVLGIPDKADQRAEPGTGWTRAELNHAALVQDTVLVVPPYLTASRRIATILP